MSRSLVIVALVVDLSLAPGCGDDAGTGSADGVTLGSDESGDGDGDPSGDGDGDPSGDGDGDGDPSGDGDGDPGPFPGCGMPSPGPGTHVGLTVNVNGSPRAYEMFVPSTYDPDVPAPLVLNFHGLLGTPMQQAQLSQFNVRAQERGMIVAYPVGIGNSFNAGFCCGEAQSSGVDDEAFARALVDQLLAQMCIDPARVYATGMSNGGHMAHLLACHTADVFAATASVAGVLSFNPFECQPSRPISIIQFHGTDDLIVGYDAIPPVAPMMSDWAARNGCSPVSQVSFASGDTTCETWPGCDDGVEVTLCTIEGGGHCWPGNPACLFGNSTTQLHASEEIADMFLEQGLP